MQRSNRLEKESEDPKTAPPKRTRQRKSAQTETRPSKSTKQAILAKSQPRLQAYYKQEVAPVMAREFGHANPMAIPKVSKVVLNIGLGEALTNPRAAENSVRDLSIISGQKPVTTKAHRSIAGFKLREGMTIGTMVTLRGSRMYDFLDRLLNAAIPRIRDFRGISRRSVDGRGNFSLGIREHTIFPEIDYSRIDRIRGLQVSIVTSATNDTECIRLLELMGMPFVQPGSEQPEDMGLRRRKVISQRRRR